MKKVEFFLLELSNYVNYLCMNGGIQSKSIVLVLFLLVTL